MSEILWCADNGDGTYRNPVLYCDYSDPDAICVNGTYYLTASTFNYVPGLPILTSRDLVNWKLRNYAVKNIPEARYAAPQHAQSIWAPAIRFQNGRFYIYYGMPDEGIYMVSTENPLGDWETPVLVKPGKGLIDPCPFWDDDGRAYIIHGYAKSRIGFKSRLGIFPISPDGKTALGDDHLLYDGTKKHPTIEGPKVHKRDGWYYIFAPAGGVATGWQVCLRSRSISGPYETQVVLKQGSSETNGPHQGAWVETPEGGALVPALPEPWAVRARDAFAADDVAGGRLAVHRHPGRNACAAGSNRGGRGVRGSSADCERGGLRHCG